MQPLYISRFCLRRERGEKGVIIQVVGCFFCAPAKDKLLLLKAHRDLQGPAERRWRQGAGVTSQQEVCVREKKRRGEVSGEKKKKNQLNINILFPSRQPCILSARTRFGQVGGQ